MELNELKASWIELNSKVNHMEEALNATTITQKVQAPLRKEPTLEIVIGALTLLWTGGFMGDNFGAFAIKPALALPALFIHCLAIAVIAHSIWQLVLIQKLEWTQPVVETQTRLAEIKRFRVKGAKQFFAASLTGWFAFPILLLQTLLGPSVLTKVNPFWILSNIAFGFIVIIGIILVSHRIGDSHSVTNKFNEFLAGTPVTLAERELKSLSEF
jgi:hypothetical protein